MAYQLSELITDVRRLLDEQAADESLLVNSLGEPSGEPSGTVTDVDDTELDALIRGYAEEARNFVLKGCDASLLSKDLLRTEVNVINSVSFSDCLRLVRVSGSDWKRDVSEFIDASSPDFAMIKDSIAGGTVYSPRVGIRYGDGSNFVELTPFPAGQIKVYYVTSIATSGSLLVITGDVVRMALRHYLAGLVCQSLGDSRADNFFELAMTYMGVSGGQSKKL